jgi:hypothetical protein
VSGAPSSVVGMCAGAGDGGDGRFDTGLVERSSPSSGGGGDGMRLIPNFCKIHADWCSKHCSIASHDTCGCLTTVCWRHCNAAVVARKLFAPTPTLKSDRFAMSIRTWWPRTTSLCIFCRDPEQRVNPVHSNAQMLQARQYMRTW